MHGSVILAQHTASPRNSLGDPPDSVLELFNFLPSKGHVLYKNYSSLALQTWENV